MTPESVPKRSASVRARKFRGQLLISINEETFELSDSAEFIFRGINGRRSVQEIGVLLAEKYAIPVDTAVEDVAELLDALARSDILEFPGLAVAAEEQGWTYASKFGNWENRASVRNKPPRILMESSPATVFFPPEAVPAVSDPLVAQRGPAVAQRLLVHSLYQYLHFTTVLEQVAVLPVTARISLDRAGVPALPAAMRADAFKITTDEAWHAQSSHDFTERVVVVTGVPASAVVEPRFARLLARHRDGFDLADRALVDLVFAVVSETLVTSLLADLPFDRRLPEPVRALVADHAADEGRHHSYFRAFLRCLWPQLTGAQRRLIGPRVPEFVEVFLHPDLGAVRAALTASGFTAAESDTVVRRSYPPGSPVFDIASAARATVRAFREVGALEDPSTREAFLAAGLE